MLGLTVTGMLCILVWSITGGYWGWGLGSLAEAASGEQIERQISRRTTEPAVITASHMGCLGRQAHRSFSRCCQVIRSRHQSKGSFLFTAR